MQTFATFGQVTFALILGSLPFAGCGGDSTTTMPPGTTGQALTFTGEATGSQASPPTSSDSKGLIELTLSADETTLTYKVSHNVTAVSALELRSGKLGERGALLVKLDDTSPSGSVVVTAAQAADLKAGRVYLNIQSASFNVQGPLNLEGEVRGQIFGTGAAAAASGTTQFSAQLNGLQRFPPLSIASAGAAQLSLNEQSGELTYSIQHNLAGALSASLGLGGFTLSGDVLATLGSGSPLSTTVTGKATLTAEQQRKLKSGLLFLELQGSAAAVLRGQILFGKATPFSINLGAAPLVSTTAKGTVSFFLSEDQTRLNYRINHTALDATSAVIIKGDVALGGQVVCTLGSGKDRDQGSCAVKASGGASDLLVGDLMTGMLHVDVLTKAKVSGELRGVVMLPPRQ